MRKTLFGSSGILAGYFMTMDNGRLTMAKNASIYRPSSIVHRQPSIVYFLRFWEMWGT
jgi:hypothetical protein